MVLTTPAPSLSPGAGTSGGVAADLARFSPDITGKEPMMTDLSQFHYYDQKPQFTVELQVWGTASITVAADSKEDAEAQAEAMIEDEDFVPDLETADDISIGYVTANPTRMYLVTDTSRPSVTATSRPSETCVPRDPRSDDTSLCERYGWAMSWAQEAARTTPETSA